MFYVLFLWFLGVLISHEVGFLPSKSKDLLILKRVGYRVYKLDLVMIVVLNRDFKGIMSIKFC